VGPADNKLREQVVGEVWRGNVVVAIHRYFTQLVQCRKTEQFAGQLTRLPPCSCGSADLKCAAVPGLTQTTARFIRLP
jgi:hypothetical protein